MTESKDKKKPAYLEADLKAMGVGKHYTQWMFSWFQPWLQGSICEVGAGTGNNVDPLLNCNPDRLVLLEPDRNLFDTLSQTTNDCSKTVAANKTLSEYMEASPETFDAFLYLNVLEHIEHDEEELKMMHSRLNRGGAALILVPAMPSLFSKYDRKVGHWRRYRKEELRSKIEGAGFHLERLRYFDFLGFFAWLLSCKVFGMQLNPFNVRLYDRLAVPVSSGLEKVANPPVGKNLLAVALKN